MMRNFQDFSICDSRIYTSAVKLSNFQGSLRTGSASKKYRFLSNFSVAIQEIQSGFHPYSPQKRYGTAHKCTYTTHSDILYTRFTPQWPSFKTSPFTIAHCKKKLLILFMPNKIFYIPRLNYIHHELRAIFIVYEVR